MGDLEEAFLKSNVPGRYSAWADDDGGGENDNADIDSAAAVAGGSSPSALNRLEAPTSRNTGAKGVLADHRAAKEEEAYRREVEKRESEAILDRAVRGAAMGAGEVSISQAAVEERRRAERIRAREAERGDSSDTDGDGDSSDGDDDEDDEFMRSYRQKRLLELQNAASSASASAPTAANTSRPQYSEVEDVTPIQYAEAVDETDPGTLLVVHLYEPHIPACVDVNHHLDTLARSHACANSGRGSIRFLRLRATEAKSDMDLVGLPSILVYRGGRLLHNWTPVTEMLPPRFTAEDLQTLLLDSCCDTASTTVTSTASTGIRRGDSYDSDDAELDEFCANFAG